MALVKILKLVKSANNLSKIHSRFTLTKIHNLGSNINSIYLYELLQIQDRSLHLSALENKKDVVSNRPLAKEQNLQPGIETIQNEYITAADVSWMKNHEVDVLEPSQEDVSDISPFTSPSFNLAAYANRSPTLQELVKMGVDLNKIEKCKGAPEVILKLDFERHMKQHLVFLHDNGVPPEEFGRFVTKNPFIFEQQLDDLQIRINYLEAKRFTPSAIASIITKNPSWLNFSTIQIDKRLGFFQRNFILSGEEVRHLATLRPRLITYDLGLVSISLFAVKEDMGFSEGEAKALLLKKPKLYDMQKNTLVSRFDYVHNVMNISHKQILQHPNILMFRNFIIKERHEFLKEIGKAQYNPKLPGYISLDTLVHGDDVEFCKNVAKTSIDVFNAFLKTR